MAPQKAMLNSKIYHNQRLIEKKKSRRSKEGGEGDGAEVGRGRKMVRKKKTTTLNYTLHTVSFLQLTIHHLKKTS